MIRDIFVSDLIFHHSLLNNKIYIELIEEHTYVYSMYLFHCFRLCTSPLTVCLDFLTIILFSAYKIQYNIPMNLQYQEVLKEANFRGVKTYPYPYCNLTNTPRDSQDVGPQNCFERSATLV